MKYIGDCKYNINKAFNKIFFTHFIYKNGKTSKQLYYNKFRDQMLLTSGWTL